MSKILAILAVELLKLVAFRKDNDMSKEFVTELKKIIVDEMKK